MSIYVTLLQYARTNRAHISFLSANYLQFSQLPSNLQPNRELGISTYTSRPPYVKKGEKRRKTREECGGEKNPPQTFESEMLVMSFGEV